VERHKAFDIEFMRLADGLHEFEFDINDTFFEPFPQNRIFGGELSCKVKLIKEETLLQLLFDTEGSVSTQCDRCLNEIKYPVKSSEKLIVTLGKDYKEEDLDVIEIPASEHKLNIAQYVYEYILTSLPMYVNCDGLENMVCDEQTLKFIVPEQKEVDNEPGDPRWNILKNIDLDK